MVFKKNISKKSPCCYNLPPIYLVNELYIFAITAEMFNSRDFKLCVSIQTLTFKNKPTLKNIHWSKKRDN